MEIYLSAVLIMGAFPPPPIFRLFIAGNNGKEKIIELQKNAMELFIAGNYGKKNGATPTDPKNISGNMEMYVASNFQMNNRAKVIPYLDREETIEVGGIKLVPFTSLNILESYYYLRGNDSFARLIKGFQNFLLDSGAFTFLSNAKTKVNWERYIEEYAEYITNNDIKLFFELDIDSIVGLKQVEKYRERLERLTNRQCIPVWHPSRGYDYFIQMCKDYPYVALGGIVSQDIPRDKYEKIFPKMIYDAHSYNAKIHGLGYTSIDGLFRYRFDSVDSTAWLYGNRGGYLYKFNHKTGKMDKIEPSKGMRLNSRKTALHNFNEWIKFQKYARKYL